MRFSIGFKQYEDAIGKILVIGFVELRSVNTNNKKAAFLHIKIYRAVLEKLKRIVTVFVNTPDVEVKNEKAAFLHIKIYRAVLEKLDGLSKSLCELAINEVFNSECTEYKHPTQSERFITYTVEGDMDKIDPEIVSEMTIRLSNKIHELVDELSKESKTGAFRY